MHHHFLGHVASTLDQAAKELVSASRPLACEKLAERNAGLRRSAKELEHLAEQVRDKIQLFIEINQAYDLMMEYAREVRYLGRAIREESADTDAATVIGMSKVKKKGPRNRGPSLS